MSQSLRFCQLRNTFDCSLAKCTSKGVFRFTIFCSFWEQISKIVTFIIVIINKEILLINIQLGGEILLISQMKTLFLSVLLREKVFESQLNSNFYFRKCLHEYTMSDMGHIKTNSMDDENFHLTQLKRKYEMSFQ